MSHLHGQGTLLSFLGINTTSSSLLDTSLYPSTSNYELFQEFDH